MIDLDIKMAEVMIHYSAAVQAGDTVLLYTTSPVAETMIQALYQETLRTGAHAVSYISLRDETALAMESTDDLELLSSVNPMLETMYAQADVIIFLAADENPRGMSAYPTEKVKAIGKRGNKLRQAMFNRTGKGELRRCSAFYPTNGYAMRAGMSFLQYKRFFYEGCKLHLENPISAWKKLAEKQQKWVDYLADKKTIRVQGKDVDLTCSIDGRKFINACGHANLPDGEIFTCPVEDSVNGWVHYSFPAYLRGFEVEDIELVYKDGIVVEAKAGKNEHVLLDVLSLDEGSKRLGEFAFGTNYDIKRFSGSIVFDEKIGGTMHTALGMSYKETGGKNSSEIHWDMICDLRGDSVATADGEIFYKDGDFIID